MGDAPVVYQLEGKRTLLGQRGELLEQFAAASLSPVEKNERPPSLDELGIKSQSEAQGVLHGPGPKSS